MKSFKNDKRFGPNGFTLTVHKLGLIAQTQQNTFEKIVNSSVLLHFEIEAIDQLETEEQSQHALQLEHRHGSENIDEIAMEHQVPVGLMGQQVDGAPVDSGHHAHTPENDDLNVLHCPLGAAQVGHKAKVIFEKLFPITSVGQ